MAKTSAIVKNKKRAKMSVSFRAKRERLKAVIKDKNVALEERFAAQIKLAELPRDGSKSRVRNRCELSGRPRAYYRKFKLSRIALRDLAAIGQLPGVFKASW